MFWCHSWRLKMFLVTFDFEQSILRSSVMEVVFINEYGSHEISNQMFFYVINVLIFGNKWRTGYDINIAK